MSQPTLLVLAKADNSPVDIALQSGALTADDPFAANRHTAFSEDQGIAAGLVEGNLSADIAAYPYSEMLVVHRGTLTLHSGEQRLDVAPGESVVIGRGTTVRVEASANTRAAFCTSTQASGPDKPGVFAIDRRAVLAPSSPPEAGVLIGPAPQCRSNNLFEDTASTLRIGVWDSTPYERIARPHKVHELMHLLEGQVELRLDNGQVHNVNPGDTVFVAQGAPCKWTSQVYVRKFYAVT